MTELLKVTLRVSEQGWRTAYEPGLPDNPEIRHVHDLVEALAHSIRLCAEAGQTWRRAQGWGDATVVGQGQGDMAT
jgi:hypothetical protein